MRATALPYACAPGAQSRPRMVTRYACVSVPMHRSAWRSCRAEKVAAILLAHLPLGSGGGSALLWTGTRLLLIAELRARGPRSIRPWRGNVEVIVSY